MTEYTIDNVADAQAALLDYIDMQGYSGYAGMEAAKTISGSFSMVRSAWSNLVTGIADDNADMDELMENFVDSVGVAGENILPRVEVALNGAASLIERLFPVIMEQFPTIIQNTLPKILDSGINIIKTLMQGISDNKEIIVSTALDVIKTLTKTFVDSIPEIIAMGADLLIAFIDGLADDPDAVIETAIELVTNIVTGLAEALPKIVKAAAELVLALIGSIGDHWDDIKETGAEIISKIGTGISESLYTIVNFGKQIVDKIKDGIAEKWGNLTDWFGGLWDRLFGNREVNVNVNHTGYDGSHASGLRRVPFDGYIAQLHEGERVLTKSEAKSYGEKRDGVTVIQNIYAQAQTAADLQEEARFQQERAVLLGV